MGRPSEIPPERWTEARFQYELGNLGMQSIADHLGVTKARIGQVSKQQGWVKGSKKLMVDTSSKKPVLEAPVNGGVKLSSTSNWSPDPLKVDYLNQNEDWILSLISQGKSYQEIIAEMACSLSTFMRWLDATEQREALVARARQASAYAFTEEAERNIAAAQSPLDIAKAKELAVHLRWKAKAFNPRVFGDKQQVELSGTVKQEMDDSELDRRILELQRTVDAETKLIP